MNVLIIAEPHFNDYDAFSKRVSSLLSKDSVNTISGQHEMVKRFTEEKHGFFVDSMKDPDKVIIFWDNKYEPVREEMNKWLKRGKHVSLTNTARDYWRD